MEVSIFNIRTIETEGKGFLSFFESKQDAPFQIERIYYIHGVPVGVQRGGHAHRALKQILFCPYGSIEVFLDDGSDKTSVLLDNPSKGLLVNDMIWRDMVWREPSSVLIVAASMHYDESDYIRDYATFMDCVRSSSNKGE